MAAPTAAPLEEGKAKKVIRQVRDPPLLPQLHNFFSFSRAILPKSTYMIWLHLHQVEFYFSDSNLPRDKFLRETVEQSDDGCNAHLLHVPAVWFCLVLWVSC